MQAHGSRNLLCDFSWGDYLIWRMAPASKVFIDGRYDFAYPMPVIRDYFDFKFDSSHAAAVLDSYPHDYVLMTPASPVRELMARRPDWKLIYRDPRVLLFERADSAAAHLDGVRYRVACSRRCFPKARARNSCRVPRRPVAGTIDHAPRGGSHACGRGASGGGRGKWHMARTRKMAEPG